MNVEPVFSELLVSALKSWSDRKVDECILSISVLVRQSDPLMTLPLITEKHQFRFLWDLFPGLCISATGQSHLEDFILRLKEFKFDHQFDPKSNNHICGPI